MLHIAAQGLWSPEQPENWHLFFLLDKAVGTIL